MRTHHIATSALLLFGATLLTATAASAQEPVTTIVNTARGGSVTTTRVNDDHRASKQTVVTTANGRTANGSKTWNKDTHMLSKAATGPRGRSASAATTIDADRSDGRVGLDREATGSAGRTRTMSRTTSAQDGTIVHDARRTGGAGRTASRQDVYTRDGSSHTHTGRGGRTRSWSRSRPNYWRYRGTLSLTVLHTPHTYLHDKSTI